jgi:hypothetical protein
MLADYPLFCISASLVLVKFRLSEPHKPSIEKGSSPPHIRGGEGMERRIGVHGFDARRLSGKSLPAWGFSPHLKKAVLRVL